MLFGGNLLRQPAFAEMKKDKPNSMRTIGNMVGSDNIMMNTLFLGTYPGLTKEMLEKEISVIIDFATTRKQRKI